MSKSRYHIEEAKEKINQSKAFLFDFDGTIANLDKLNVNAFQKLFKENFNIEFTTEDFMKYVSGKGSRNGIDNFLNNHDIKEYSTTELNKQFQSNKRTLIEKNIEQSVYLIPGLIEILTHIEDNNQRKIIVTSSRDEYVENILQPLNIYSRFEKVFDRNSVIKGKPYPDPFLKGLEYLNLKPEECIAFEDSFYGLQSSKGAGIFTIGILNKGWNDDFVHTLADYVIEDYREIL